MATIVAAKAGNWSDTTVWTGGVLPGLNDYASTAFAINLDQDITILGLRYTASGGVLNIAGSTNRTINLTATDAFAFTTSVNWNYIVITNTATTNINSYFPQDAANTGTKVINCNSVGGTINITATDGVLTRGSGSTRTSQPVVFSSVSQNQTVNIIGSIATSNYSQSYVTMAGTNNTVNFTGNIGCASTNQSADFVYTTGTNCTLNFTGSIIGNTQPAFISTNNTNIININGIVQGSTVYPVIQSTGNGLITYSGQVTSLNDINAIYAKYIRLKNSLDTQMTFQTEVLNTNKTIYSAATSIGLPATTNVRTGVVYGDASQFTGTMTVPSPTDVRVNVPTDNTVGMANLTAEDMWNRLTSAITTSNSIGKLLKDNIDTTISSRSTNTGIVTELNTSNVDVAVRLRNVSTVSITGEQIEAQ